MARSGTRRSEAHDEDEDETALIPLIKSKVILCANI